MSEKLGLMTVRRWQDEGHFGSRVLCDGIDITDRCRAFDDIQGWALVFVADDAGRPMLRRDGDLATETLVGSIEVRRSA